MESLGKVNVSARAHVSREGIHLAQSQIPTLLSYVYIYPSRIWSMSDSKSIPAAPQEDAQRVLEDFCLKQKMLMKEWPPKGHTLLTTLSWFHKQLRTARWWPGEEQHCRRTQMFRSLKINCCMSGTSRLRCFIQTPRSTGNGESVSVLSWSLCYQACVCVQHVETSGSLTQRGAVWRQLDSDFHRHLWVFSMFFWKKKVWPFQGSASFEEVKRLVTESHFHGSMFSSALLLREHTFSDLMKNNNNKWNRQLFR